jgi:hypothetical protein
MCVRVLIVYAIPVPHTRFAPVQIDICGANSDALKAWYANASSPLASRPTLQTHWLFSLFSHSRRSGWIESKLRFLVAKLETVVGIKQVRWGRCVCACVSRHAQVHPHPVSFEHANMSPDTGVLFMCCHVSCVRAH